MQPPRRPSCARAFTLVELLVVVTLLAGLLTAFAVFSTKPDSGRRVGLGMQFLAGKLRETRGVAAMRLTQARLLIHADPSQPELMWQSCVIVSESETGSGTWEVFSEPQKLPPGVCWVPPDGAGGWSGPLSTGGMMMPLPQTARAGAWKPGCACWAYEFTPTGRIANRHYDLILGEGSTTGGVGVLQNSKNYRGLRVNAYGHVIEVADLVPGS